jgi:hypothetical protein
LSLCLAITIAPLCDLCLRVDSLDAAMLEVQVRMSQLVQVAESSPHVTRVFWRYMCKWCSDRMDYRLL